jgi:hypothetical protein
MWNADESSCRQPAREEVRYVCDLSRTARDLAAVINQRVHLRIPSVLAEARRLRCALACPPRMSAGG